MEINNNCFGVEPPKDASGNIIPLDTETLYDLTGKAISVDSFRYSTGDEKKRWIVTGYSKSFGYYRAGYTDDFTLFEPDSWDKLIKDLKTQVTVPSLYAGILIELAKTVMNVNSVK